MDNMNGKSGFVLMMTMVLSSVVAIMLGGVYGYVSSMTRAAATYETGTKCRLAAQSALEEYKVQLHSNLLKIYRNGSYSSLDDLMARASLSMGQSDPTDESSVQFPKIYNGYEASIVKSEVMSSKLDNMLSPHMVIKIVASATPVGRENFSGASVKISKTIEEIVFVELSRDAFNYALFVNGPAHIGSKFPAAQRATKINGPVHANGGLDVVSVLGGKDKATFNGDLSAAQTGLSSLGSIYTHDYNLQVNVDATRNSFLTENYLDYIKNKLTSARSAAQLPYGEEYSDTGDYRGVVAMKSNTEAIQMPNIDNLDIYKQVAQSSGSTLTYTQYSMDYTRDAKGVLVASNERTTLSSTYGIDKPGPSGDINAADKGTLLLIGTEKNPIVINGPIVVDRDVLIKGYVKGQGSIFSGRNVTIIGDIKYVNPPKWDGKSNENQVAINAGKDMLALCARGNIVIGKPVVAETKPYGWNDFGAYYAEYYRKDTIDSAGLYSLGTALYMGDDRMVQALKMSSYTTDVPAGTKSDIGYEHYFDGNYLAKDGLNRVAIEGVDRDGNVKYGDVPTRFCDPLVSENIIEKAATYDISNIDATLYCNNATMMTGRTSNSMPNGRDVVPIKINGAVISRNLCLPTNTGALNINWDLRLSTTSADGKAMKNSPMNVCFPYTPTALTTLSWRETKMPEENI